MTEATADCSEPCQGVDGRTSTGPPNWTGLIKAITTALNRWWLTSAIVGTPGSMRKLPDIKAAWERMLPRCAHWARHDSSPTLLGVVREAAEVNDLKKLIERVRLHPGNPGKGMVHRQDREQHE